MKRILIYSLFSAVIFSACKEGRKRVKTQSIHLTHTDEIVQLNDSLVKPIVYENTLSFENLSIEEKKEKFIASILPAVLIVRHNLASDQEMIKSLAEQKKWSTEDSVIFEEQMKKFGATDIDNLLNRMETHPNSITLAQAGVESAWGSSRFFREANNLFGIWAYNADQPTIAASESNVNLRKYENVSASIESYFVTLGRARPYEAFREAKKETNNIHELLPHLKYYSEQGMRYVKQLETVIRQNELTKYDNYQLDPWFIEEE